MKKYLCGLMVLVSVQAIAQKAKPKTTKPIVAAATKTEFIKPKSDETIVEITTDMGVMKARLYNSTPQHRDNFIKLIKQGFCDSQIHSTPTHKCHRPTNTKSLVAAVKANKRWGI